MTITINDKDYTLAEDWSDITISKCIELSRIVGEAPDCLKTGKFTDEDSIKTAPEFYGRVIGCLADVSDEVMNQVLWADRTVIYANYCHKFVADLMGQPSEVQKIDSFSFDGVTYTIPLSKMILGQERIGADVTTIEFSESADLELYSRKLKGGMIEVLPNIIAILCRPKGERYNEAVALARAEKFKELPMSVAWSVFFSFSHYITDLLPGTQMSLREEEYKQAKQHSEQV